MGKKVLSLAINRFHASNAISISGEVLPGNIASAKTFESLGFKLKHTRGNKIYKKEVKDLGVYNV